MRIKIVIAASVLSLMTINACAQLSAFTEHQVVYMARHGVNKYDDVRFKTGDYPYIGKLGLQYDKGRMSYSVAYIHRSNVDLHGDEYNYDGVSLGVKYTHCLMQCR